MEYLVAFLTLAAVYFIGSINFAIILSKNIKGVDVRNYGSGNAGATNALRVAGRKAGILTFACDMLKGALSVVIGYFVCKLYLYPINELFNPVYGAYICGFVCMIGHCWPIFFEFKGGKAAAAGLAIFAVCCWPSAVAGAICFGITIIISRKVSLSSLVATVIVAATSVVCGFTGFFDNVNGVVILVVTVLAAILIFYRHKSNIERLISGEEKDISVAEEK